MARTIEDVSGHNQIDRKPVSPQAEAKERELNAALDASKARGPVQQRAYACADKCRSVQL